MKTPLNILFASAEVMPFSKTGGLADVAGVLPVVLGNHSCNITVLTPLYASVPRQEYSLFSPESSHNIMLADEAYPVSFYLLEKDNVRYIFVSNDFFYSRAGIYTTSDGEGYPDNNARFFFFQKAILLAIEIGLVEPEIIHVNDHHTALIPWMVENRGLSIPTLLTVHNSMYQGQFSKEDISLLDTVDQQALARQKTPLNALQIGLTYSTAVNTVSETYRDELVTIPELSYGLHATIELIQDQFTGILNGADYQYWNPENDSFIIENYDKTSVQKKQANKENLQKILGLPVKQDAPFFGSISRQVESKGFDHILAVMESFISSGCQFVFLGTGDSRIMKEITAMANRHNDHVAYAQEYNEPLAHHIEAGADFFLMPSEYEPCGLNQIYSLRYGTIPIVRKTGGLADTVIPWDGVNGHGFVFDAYTAAGLKAAMEDAVKTYRSPHEWSVIIQNAMKQRFSWDNSAKKYRNLYDTIIKRGQG